MDIKERFYANLDLIREDYGKKDSDDAKELENIASGKVSRKSDKKIQKMFKRDAAKLRKKAVTGMDEETEQLDEVSDKTHMSYRAKSKNYLDKQVKMLNKRSDAEYADASKMNRRAEGIKRSFKLQFRKKK